MPRVRILYASPWGVFHRRVRHEPHQCPAGAAALCVLPLPSGSALPANSTLSADSPSHSRPYRPGWTDRPSGDSGTGRSHRPCGYNGFCWCRRPYGSDRTGWCGDTRCGCNGCHQHYGYCDPIQSAVGQHADSRPAVQLTRKRTIQLDLNTKEGRRTAPPLLAQRRRSYENCCVCHLQK